MGSMSGSEIAALVASLVSVGIGVLAIWLSIQLYQMTTGQAERSREAAKDIWAAVNRLEKLFDRMYGDVWSMTKETVAEVTRHAWIGLPGKNAEPPPNVTDAANAKFEELRSGVMRRIEEILKKQERTDLSIEAMQAQVKSAVDMGMQAARSLDQEEMRRLIRSEALQAARQRIPCDPDSFVAHLVGRTGLEEKSVIAQLDEMLHDDIFQIEVHESGGYMGSPVHRSRILSLTEKGKAAAKDVAKHTSPSKTKEGEELTKPST